MTKSKVPEKNEKAAEMMNDPVAHMKYPMCVGCGGHLGFRLHFLGSHEGQTFGVCVACTGLSNDDWAKARLSTDDKLKVTLSMGADLTQLETQQATAVLEKIKAQQ